MAAEPLRTPPRVVVMGVTGCGKTTVGTALAQRLGVTFADGDAFHPQANIDKMSHGIPLDDEDRAPWLAILAGWLHDHAHTGGVVGCSALKHAYRDILRSGASDVVFLHLHGDRAVIAARVAARPGHFMPTSLVDSQYATLEHLCADERGVVVDVDLPVDEIVEAYLRAVPEHAVLAPGATAAAPALA